ncbi:MAG: hypothetical protein NTY77_13615 [Elusimicrobia bacterium]|nr:hypothetical protein [Elusimicrobiota bacterium]
MTGKGPVVAFLESAGQVEAVLSGTPRPDVLLALAPTAAARLEAAGIPYTKAEDLYDERALCDGADAVLDAEADWARQVDGWLQERVPAFREAGFRPAHLHFFWLKVMFDALYLRAHILQAVAASLKPARVIYFENGPRPVPSWDLVFRESLTARCLPAWAHARGIPLERRPRVGDERFAPPPRKGRWRPEVAARKLAAGVRFWWTGVRTKNAGPEACPRALLRPDCDVEYLVRPLARRGLRPMHWSRFLASLDGTGAPPATIPSLQGIAEQDWWAAPLRPEGLDLTEAAQDRLDLWWTQVIPQTWSAFTAARREFRTGSIAAVIVPAIYTHQDAAVMAAALAERVPSFVYQHGGFGGNCEYSAWEHQDLCLSRTMFFYGEGSAAHYSRRLQRYADRRARPVATGSARLDALAHGPGVPAALRRRLNAGRAPEAPLALYFPTLHPAYTRYLCCGELPDVSHWELQRDIVRLFKRFPAVRLIYRPFAGSFASPIPDLLAQELPSARIESAAPLPELARAVDLIITDIPSTGLLEALLTDRPVFVYSDDRSVRLTGPARDLLQRRAALDGTPKDFLTRLEAYLRAGDFRPSASADDSFLRAYGTCLGDGRSSERAADLIVQAIHV